MIKLTCFAVGISLIVGLIQINGISAQVSSFNRVYPLDFPSTIFEKIVVTDSFIYTTGIAADSMPPYRAGVLFAKFDLNGNPLVVNNFIDPNKEYYGGGNLIRTTGNLYLRTGSVANFSVSTDVYKTYIFCYSSNGDTIFTKEYISPYHSLAWIGDIVQTPDEGFLFAGHIKNPDNGDLQVFLLKTDNLGDFQWEQIYGDPDLDEYVAQLLSQTDGSYLVNVMRTNYQPDWNHFICRNLILRLTNENNIVEEWESTDERLLFPNYISISSDNGYIISGGLGTEVPINANSSYIRTNGYIYKLNEAMEPEWDIVFKDTIASEVTNITKLLLLPDGSGYLGSGTVFESLVGVTDTGWNINGWVVKFTEQGDSLWSRYFHYWDAPFDEHYFYDMEQMPDGGVLLCGQAYSGNAGTQQQLGWLVKLDEFGCLVPGCQLVATENIEDNPQEAALLLYPNPASDILNIYTWSPHMPKNALLRIVSSDGQVVRESPVTRSDMTSMIPVRDIPAGVYFVQYVEGGLVVATEEAVIAR